jgi:DNA-binding transcriptional ArsR family regulator
MRIIHHPDKDDLLLANVLYALGDPVRLEIVMYLDTHGEIPCSAFQLGIAKSTLSHHFKILRDAGVLFCRKEGTQHINSLRRVELDERFPGLLDAILKNAPNRSYRDGQQA